MGKVLRNRLEEIVQREHGKEEGEPPVQACRVPGFCTGSDERRRANLRVRPPVELLQGDVEPNATQRGGEGEGEEQNEEAGAVPPDVLRRTTNDSQFSPLSDIIPP